MGQKPGFLNLLKNLVINFYWACSIVKIYIICYVLAQIPCLGKFLSLGYGRKCSQPIRLQDFLINHISITNQWNRLRVDQKIFGLAWSEIGMPSLVKDSEIDCISRKKRWNELIFGLLVQIHITKLFQWFLDGCGQKWAWPFSSWDPKICCI